MQVRHIIGVLLTVAAVAVAPCRAFAQEDYPPPEGDYPPPEGAESEGDYPPPEGDYPPPEGDYPPPEGDYPPPEGEEPGGEADRPVKVSAFVFTHQEIDEPVATEVVAGIRRGLRADDRLSWVDPSRALAEEDPEEDVAAIEAAEAAVAEAWERAADGQWRDVTRLVDDAMEVFEAHLSMAHRSTLVDATLLWGTAQCMQRRQRSCESAFRSVVTFRESVEWDPRLPEHVASVFEEVREETLSGARGSIRIEAFPSGTEVFVDGRFVGAAPCSAEGLLAGDHFVSLKRLGYGRQVERVTVETEYEETVSFELMQLGNAPLLRDALRGAQAEMGEPRVGAGMRDLWSLLLVDQILLGDLQRVGDSEEFELTLYLYDLRTRHGLNRVAQRLNWETSDLPAAEALVAELYRDVDLSGRIRPVDEPLPQAPRGPEPFYRTWWFWSIIGAAIVATTIGLSSALLSQRVPPGQGLLELRW